MTGNADKRENDRRLRLAAALRENLKRRKAQARAGRADSADAAHAGEEGEQAAEPPPAGRPKD